MLLFDFRGQRIQSIFAPRRQHYRQALARERTRKLKSDSRRRARHESPLAVFLTIFAPVVRHRDFLQLRRGPSCTSRRALRLESSSLRGLNRAQ